MLSDAATFEWGAVGAIIALLVGQVLPAAFELVRSGAGPTITFWRVCGMLLILVIFTAAGGLAAVLIGDAGQAKVAIAYGLAWQAILGGAIKTGHAALPPAG